MRRYLLRLRASLCTSIAVFLGATSAPLATVFRGPLGWHALGGLNVSPLVQKMCARALGLRHAIITFYFRLKTYEYGFR